MKTFIFDFDSTIFPGETLDEIMQSSIKEDVTFHEKSDKITAVCNQGMSGEISMKESLKRRLEIAGPDKQNIDKYVSDNKGRIDSQIKTLLKQIQEKGHKVFVVSGGFEEWIKPLLDNVVPSENIHANKILDINRPMTFENIIRRDKEEIVNGLIENYNLKESEIFIIGDGATDFSVFENGIADNFIGTFFYTGLESRKTVIEKAKQNNQQYFSNLNNFEEYIQKITN